VLLEEKTWHGLLTRDTQVGGKIIEVVHGNPPKKHFSLDEGSNKKGKNINHYHAPAWGPRHSMLQ